MMLLRYIVKRVGQMLIVLVCVSILSFALMRLAPGDPARLYLPEEASDEAIADMRTELGLDKPYTTQYFMYMKGLLKGDMGTSITYKSEVLPIILDRLPKTITLTLATTLVSLIISIPLGIIAGVKQGGIIDFGAMAFALLGQSMSTVWLGVLNVFLFSVILNWLPALGEGGLKYLILPALTLGYPMASQLTRLGRSGMVDVLHEDYITSIRAKGIPDSLVYSKYAFKNALIPIVTILGLQIGTYLGGAVVVERIFSYAGIGQLIFSSVGNRDYPMVQSLLIVSAAIFVVINLAVDIVNSIIDPRIKLQ